MKSESEVAQSCLTLSDPMDCSLPGSSTHGIFQARVLEWGAIAFSVNVVSTPKSECPSLPLGPFVLPWPPPMLAALPLPPRGEQSHSAEPVAVSTLNQHRHR